MDVIKKKMRVFRKKELVELLQFFHLDIKGKKAILKERALSYIQSNCLQGPNKIHLEEKLDELVLSSKILLRKRISNFVAPPSSLDLSPLMEELIEIIPGQKFNLEAGVQTTIFTLTPYMINNIEKGWCDDGSNKYEVALFIWNFAPLGEWKEMDFQVFVNNRRIHRNYPGSNILYLTSSCDMSLEDNITYLRLSADPLDVENLAFRVSYLRKRSPNSLVLEHYPEPSPTSYTQHIVDKYFKDNAVRMLTLSMVCPRNQFIMQYPCRTVHCQHPEVFDLEAFLEEAQYFQQWNCPVCKVSFVYREIRIDEYLKAYVGKGTTLFQFYKSRNIVTYNPDVYVDREIICID